MNISLSPKRKKERKKERKNVQGKKTQQHTKMGFDTSCVFNWLFPKTNCGRVFGTVFIEGDRLTTIIYNNDQNARAWGSNWTCWQMCNFSIFWHRLLSLSLFLSLSQSLSRSLFSLSLSLFLSLSPSLSLPPLSLKATTIQRDPYLCRRRGWVVGVVGDAAWR